MHQWNRVLFPVGLCLALAACGGESDSRLEQRLEAQYAGLTSASELAFFGDEDLEATAAALVADYEALVATYPIASSIQELPDPTAYPDCSTGHLIGEWRDEVVTADGRTIGTIEGAVTNRDGTLVGSLRGLFGEREDSDQLFFVKLVDVEGAFLGILAGGHPDDTFRGRYIDEGQRIMGASQGVTQDTDEDGTYGVFWGQWSLSCGDLSTEGQVETTDDDNTAPERELL